MVDGDALDLAGPLLGIQSASLPYKTAGAMQPGRMEGLIYRGSSSGLRLELRGSYPAKCG